MSSDGLSVLERNKLDQTVRLMDVLRDGRSTDVFKARVGPTRYTEALQRLTVLFDEAIQKPIDDWSEELRYVADRSL